MGFFLYSTLLHMSPLIFHCVGGCWDRTQDSCATTLAVRRSNHSARSHPHSARSHPKNGYQTAKLLLFVNQRIRIFPQLRSSLQLQLQFFILPLNYYKPLHKVGLKTVEQGQSLLLKTVIGWHLTTKYKYLTKTIHKSLCMKISVADP